MTIPKKKREKPGRKGGKVRANLTIGEPLHTAAVFLGKKTFGNTSAYVEHLILNDLKDQGLNVLQIADLAKGAENKEPSL